ncbi:MAG TPA: asparagine synthase-related protein [Verrucomicrobiae bacterium]|nr:asparagine synthase-related protein [Verrucomicrobiae bacterium]
MSGIVGLLQLDGTRADRELVRTLADFLSFRGPDGCETWAEGEIALGHAALHVGRQPQRRQPATLGGIFAVVADARLDARKELIARISSAGEAPPADSSDAELILHSYARWGEDCVARLAGDFSFAVWDARNGTLFCARDHFGIEPFYFAELPGRFLFSNTIDCVRLHPEVGGELDEETIGDFLAFGLNLNPSKTAFRAIRRLPPAHCMTVSRGGIRTRRYWSAPVDGRIRYSQPDEYVEHYRAVLREAVGERVDCDRAGIFLSGGLDSSAIAAVAREISSRREPGCDLRAYTIVASGAREDSEKSFAAETAAYLRIPLETIRMDGLIPFDRGGDDSICWPEPVSDPFFGGLFRQFRQIAEGCRVVLDGEGSDNLMHFEMWPYVKDMVRRFEVGEFASAVPAYLRVRGPIWPGIRRRIGEARRNRTGISNCPEWVNEDFARRIGLRERILEQERNGVGRKHQVLPQAHASLTFPQWTHLFENENAGVTRVPVDVRYPFLDLRVVEFVLAMPAFPWIYKKSLLREAMAGKLPERVRTKPKTAQKADPLVTNLAQPMWEYVRRVEWTKESEQYVNRGALRLPEDAKQIEWASAALRPYCLNIWLQSTGQVRYNLNAEAPNG